MNIATPLRKALALTILGCCFASAALAQAPVTNEPISVIPFDRGGTRVSGQTAVRWKINKEYSLLVLTVTKPNGEVLRREFKSGEAPIFKLADDNGAPFSDGQYQYELRLTLNLPDSAKQALASAREAELQDAENETGLEKRDSAAAQRELIKSGALPAQPILLSGSFLISKGVAHLSLASDRTGTGSLPLDFDPRVSKRQLNPEQDFYGRNQAAFIPAAMRAFDQVIPDDLIVQGSTCVGFDCVNNESFGFDTIRLKENNTRIKFEDTSTGTFPSTDWQLTANDSASGGANKFSIEDVTGARVPFTVTGGAATNSIFVDSTGRVGLRTSTPVLDLHVNTGNTPAHRLEQNSSGGFTAQTWDIAGNEANFFVRDVTSGSRLPFRIRPGAPTSSIDISADGNVGIGTASPTEELHVNRSVDGNSMVLAQNTNATGVNATAMFRALGDVANLSMFSHGTGNTVNRFGQPLTAWGEILQIAGNGLAMGTLGATPVSIGTNATSRIFLSATGNIGLGGQTSPTQNIHHSSGATLTGAVWTNGSSRTLKTNIKNLSALDAFSALRGLTPVTYQYKATPSETFVGFIAEDVPELVATNDRKGLSPMDVVAVLTKVVQEQQQVISELKLKVERLEKVQAKPSRQSKKLLRQ